MTENKKLFFRVLCWLMENDQNGGCSSDRDSPSPSSASCRFDYNTRMTRSNPQSRYILNGLTEFSSNELNSLKHRTMNIYRALFLYKQLYP